jgi:IS5 family transposase
MRVDTTVVETDIHYPTDSTLLGDGVRVLTRAMKKIGQLPPVRRAPSCATARGARAIA